MVNSVTASVPRWAQIFKHTLDVFEENQCEDVSIQLTANVNRDRCRWNLPTADEVAVVIPGDGTQSYGRRDIVVHHWDGPLRRISDGSPMYESLQYPFLFVYGEDGYHYAVQMSPSNDSRLSQTDYGSVEAGISFEDKPTPTKKPHGA